MDETAQTSGNWKQMARPTPEHRPPLDRRLGLERAFSACSALLLAEPAAPLAKALADNERKILGELLAAQGKPVDLGGYYRPNADKAAAAMRPSETFNAALASLA